PLCWVLNLVAKIHQPLHCAAYYSSAFPRGDKGGNLQFVIDPKGPVRPISLHYYWDNLFGRSGEYGAVQGLARELSRDYPRTTFKAELERLDFAGWAQEGLSLARAAAYLDGDLKTAPRQSPRNEVPQLSVAYRARALEVARKQIALAGHRL